MNDVLLGAALVLALIIAFSGLLALRTTRSRLRKSASWREVAKRHDLRYQLNGDLPGLRGDLDGHPIRARIVLGSGPMYNNSYVTRLEVRFVDPLGFRINLRRAGLAHGTARLAGLRGIELGDAAFDRRVQVRGAPEERVRSYLDEARRRHVEELFARYPSARVSDAGITLELVDVLDAEQLDEALRELLSCARVLSRTDDEVSTISASGGAR